ncbi:unnamed protein product [Mytilus coruscus]|uniref:OTU domain-containing protein n=1 Tax=Mytilus coruscus TaxID=42192 RepID=A0A6J8E1F5_MYTCO|nr:unnamed protein product [Mytilus coruscus]
MQKITSSSDHSYACMSDESVNGHSFDKTQKITRSSDHSYACMSDESVNGHSLDKRQKITRSSDHSYPNMNDALANANGHSFNIMHSDHHYCKNDDVSYLVPHLSFADVVKSVPKKTTEKNEIITPTSTQVYASRSPQNSKQTYADVVTSKNAKTEDICSKLVTGFKSEAEECFTEFHNKKDTQHLVQLEPLQKQSFLNVPHNGVIAIENHNFLIYDVPGDGNCFFSSLSLAINGDFSQKQIYRSLSCSEIYNNFYIYEDTLRLSHYNNITRDIYLQTMVNGKGWATSCEISIASNITQSNINIWIQGTNLANETVFTKEQYIHSPQSRTIDLLLSHNHFQLLRGIPQFNQNKSAISNKDNKATENNMNPGEVPLELANLSVVEEQLISRISPCINIHMLKHGGIAANGHCVAFPQEVNEPGKILPKLPSEVNIIRVRKIGKNDTSKEFNVRRQKVQIALVWLKKNNHAYFDIEISEERLNLLPVDGQIQNISTLEYNSDVGHLNDQGPAPKQIDLGNDEGETISSVLLPEPCVDIKQKIQDAVEEIAKEENTDISINKKSQISIPWPTRDLKAKLQNGDRSVAEKILYFSANLRGTSQYWNQRSKELRALIQYKINAGQGLPSFFTTGSCAEFYFKPLKRILSLYIKETTGNEIDLNDHNNMFKAVQDNTHIVGDYFDKRTQSYFKEIMGPVFGVNSYWYRQEFSKSRGMIHWHGLCWRFDKEPHNLMHQAFIDGKTDDECAKLLSDWAKLEYKMTANHPAGVDENRKPKKSLASTRRHCPSPS